MKRVQQTITIAATKVRVATSAVHCARIFAQVLPGASGGLVYIGDSTMSNAGANAIAVLDAATTAVPGGQYVEQYEVNCLDASDYYVTGAHAGDTVTLTYSSI